MSSEQRVLIASALSAVLLVFYAKYLGRFTHAHPTATPASNQSQLKSGETVISTEFLEPALSHPSEERLRLESAGIKLTLGKESASIYSIELKGVKKVGSEQNLVVSGDRPLSAILVGPKNIQWTLLKRGQQDALWKSLGNPVETELEISLDETKPLVTIAVRATNKTNPQASLPIRFIASWNRSDAVSGRYNMLEAVMKTKKEQSWQREYLRYFGGSRGTRAVPRGTSLVALSERYFCLAIRPDSQSEWRTTVLPSEPGKIVVAIESSPQAVHQEQEAEAKTITLYAGPRDFFKLRDAGFEDAFPVGWLSRIGLMMVVLLKWAAAVFHNYGVAIIALSCFVTIVLAPFTLISVRSMKKMQALQPKIEQLKQKHGRDQQRMNKELFALFREHRVSPLSGCLPMLLQLPIFFALWSAMSHVAELRGERFLWVKDLSLPDRLARIPGIGMDLNLLPIIMCGAMYLQSRMTQPKVQTKETAMMSGPMMTILFGVMFYQSPSGLVLYWLTNSLMSLVWYRVAKT